MRKMFIKVATLAALIIGMWTVPTMAAEIVASGNCGAQGDNLTWTFDSDGVLKISGSGEMDNYKKINPFYPTYGGQSNSPWNQYRERIKTIELPSGLTSIGDYAFYYFHSNLYSIDIPDSVTRIGSYAFDHCEKLTGSLLISDNVKEIGDNAFYSCDFSGTLLLGDNLGSIGAWAFAGNSFVGDLEIPDRVKTIGKGAFSSGGFTGTLKLPEGITTIEDQTFDLCGFTGELVLEDTITKIGEAAFRCCDFEGDLILPKNLTAIENNTFFQCDFFTGDLIIPDAVTSIGEGAFYNCKRLNGTLVFNEKLKAIGAKAFSLCSFKGELNIPDGVGKIGDEAFYECNGFTKLKLSKNLKSVGEKAFYRCFSLTGDLEIPSEVVEIGESAFQSCERLNGSLSMGDKVKTIGGWAFSGCAFEGTLTLSKSLSRLEHATFANCSFNGDLIIPEGITYIGSYVFSQNNFENQLKIPYGVEVIGERAFFNCSFGSNEVIIPPKVRTIGTAAFHNSSIRNFYFLGNAPKVADTDTQYFPSFSKAATLYYQEGKEGWTTPTWNGYNTATWVPNVGVIDEHFNIKTYQYSLIIQDSAGNPIEGAEISCMGNELETTADGVATVEYSGAEEFFFTINEEGYQRYTSEKKLIEVDDCGYVVIRLYKAEESPLYLQEAFYKNRDRKSDILTGVKRLSFSNAHGDFLDDGMFDLHCKSVKSDLVEKYELYQENRRIAETEDGNFQDIKIIDFKEKGAVKIRAYNTVGEYVDTKINLLFVKPKEVQNETTEGTFGKKGLQFSVADNVPFIGGTDFDIEMPGLPIYAMASDDTIRIGINIDFEKTAKELAENGDINISNEAWMEDVTDIVKERTEKLRKLGEIGWNKRLTKDDRKIIEDIMASDGEMKLFAGKGSVKVVGYLEGKVNDDGETIVTGNLFLVASLKGEFESPAIWVVVVPVTLTLDVEVEGSLGGEISMNSTTGEFINSEIIVELKTKIEAAAVAGLKKLLSVGVYGQAELPIKMFIISTEFDPWTIDNIDLTGELGIKAYVLFGEYKKEYAHKTWHLYTRPDMVMMSIDDNEDRNRTSVEMEYYNWENYTIADTSYLFNESSWLGDNGMMLLDLEQTNIQELQTSTYRNMQPQIVSIGDNLVMVWIGADTSREAYNLTQLKYSVHNGIGWSEPQAVDGNDTADYLHDVYSDGENLWVVYQESATAFEKEPSLEEVAADMQIVAAKLDTTTGRFTDHTVLSNEGGYETIPVITIVDGKSYAVWTSNGDTTDLFGQNETNEIHYAEFDGEWSAAQVLADGLGPVTDLSAGDMGGKATVAYVSSADTSLETDDDNVLYTAPFGGTAEKVSSGIVSALKFAELPGEGKSSLVWYDNGSLKTVQSGAAKTVIENGMPYAAGFDVLSDRIIFNHATDGASDVFASIYENGTYQEPVRMTYQDRYIQSYSFVEHNNKAFAALVQTDVTITENAVEDDCTLSFLTFEGVTDVSLESAAYDDAELVAGEDLPAEVILKNNGDTLIKKVQLTIMDEKNEVVTSVTETVDLAAHEEVTLIVNLPIGETIHKQIYTVKASTENDANVDNNSWQLLVGDEMLSVSGEMIRSGSNVKAIVKVLNDGHETTGGTLRISSVSDGVLLIEKELTELAAGESHLMILDGEYLLNGKDSDVLQLEVQTTAGNNYSVDRIQQMYISRTIVEEESVENTLTISEVDGNVVGVEISNVEDADVAVAVYDTDGKMLAYEISTDVRSNIYNYEAFVMDLEDITEGQVVKAFMLKVDKQEPLCKAIEYVVK